MVRVKKDQFRWRKWKGNGAPTLPMDYDRFSVSEDAGAKSYEFSCYHPGAHGFDPTAGQSNENGPRQTDALAYCPAFETSPGLNAVVVATSDQPADEPICSFCLDSGIPCFVGSENDVLDRFYRAAVHFKADPVIRITADCPFVDPSVV